MTIEESSKEKALELWNSTLSHTGMLVLNGSLFLSRVSSVVRYLEKAGDLNISMYDFIDDDHIYIASYKRCRINESNTLIYCGNEYVCRLEDLYSSPREDYHRFFIIDFGEDKDKDVEFIARLVWRTIDARLGEYLNVDRVHHWCMSDGKKIPDYVVNTTRAFIENWERNIDFKFYDWLNSMWRLVNHSIVKKVLHDEYKDLGLV